MGQLVGKGKEVHRNGEAFVGSIKNYIKHGTGVIYHPDGTTETSFTGQWVHGVKIGEFSRNHRSGKREIVKYPIETEKTT